MGWPSSYLPKIFVESGPQDKEIWVRLLLGHLLVDHLEAVIVSLQGTEAGDTRRIKAGRELKGRTRRVELGKVQKTAVKTITGLGHLL